MRGWISPVIFVLLIVVVAYQWVSYPRTEKIYNCSGLIAGWHPDVPIAVQQQCRDHLIEKKDKF